MSPVIGAAPLATLPQRGRRALLAVGPALLCLLPALSGCGTYYPQGVPPVAYDTTCAGGVGCVSRSRAPRVTIPVDESSDASTVPYRADTGTTGTVASGRRHRPTPAVGSSEWEREQQATSRDQEQLDRSMRNICRNC